jgi:hypothetical protein
VKSTGILVQAVSTFLEEKERRERAQWFNLINTGFLFEEEQLHLEKSKEDAQRQELLLKALLTPV